MCFRTSIKINEMKHVVNPINSKYDVKIKALLILLKYLFTETVV